MNESITSENNSVDSEKPVQVSMDNEVKFPPFPEPTDEDFEDDIAADERDYYKTKFNDLNTIVSARLHCSACDRHLGCSAQSETRMRSHPMLRTLMCHTCHTFYNSGEFEKGDDGSELYCRWCGQGGQVYCCSECPHVFCAKCVKRNFGVPKIREIEETDDWKCFHCNIKSLWDLRAICWAVFRYCDLKNKITQQTEDPVLKETYQNECAIDLAECCKNKNRRREKSKDEKIKPKDDSKKTPTTVTKTASTIQVKKFASMNLEEQNSKCDKKTPQKRPASPKNKSVFLKNPMAQKVTNPPIMPSMPKKIRMPIPAMLTPIRLNNVERKVINSYSRIRAKAVTTPLILNGLNSNTHFNNMIVSDNINLSLESLTQGLDMATVAGISNNIQDDDVVCTPDFPLEAMSEVTDDNNDDDVQCIGPVVTPKIPPPLVPRNVNPLPELFNDNIIQMTENDVTVNAATGGLKFRVDPQTLSSNKMYRLPDGRIFAINANPNMPGGYSATIVAVTDDSALKLPPKGATYAVKLSSVGSPAQTPSLLKTYRNQIPRPNKPKRNTVKHAKQNKRTNTPTNATRECDLNVPVEWYRYNLIDAVDALEYSLSRLNKLKQEATTMFLRTRSASEMQNLHKRLDRLLNTSTCRFTEIRENINKELREYLMKKLGGNTSDDDDVEILQDDNDDPIFIDENSVESNAIESQDVDLTVLGNSDHNNSGEKSSDKNDSVQILGNESVSSVTDKDYISTDMQVLRNENNDNDRESVKADDVKICQNENVEDTTMIIDAKDSAAAGDIVNGSATKTNEINHENPIEDVITEKTLEDKNPACASSVQTVDDQDMNRITMENLLCDEDTQESIDGDVKPSLNVSV